MHCCISCYHFAQESRIELGRLYGIEDGEKILLPEELMFFYQGIQNGAPIEILEPVALFLSMDDNAFVENAMMLMKEALQMRQFQDGLGKELKLQEMRILRRG